MNTQTLNTTTKNTWYEEYLDKFEESFTEEEREYLQGWANYFNGYINSYAYGVTNISVSRIVFVWFIRDIEYGEQIDHKDDNPLNNTLDNLQALTQEENLKKKGISRNQYTWDLTDDEILKRRQLKEEKKKKSAQCHRRARCRKLAYEICKYYKEKKNFKEWHIWVDLKNKPELNMEDCYAIELTYKVLFE